MLCTFYSPRDRKKDAECSNRTRTKWGGTRRWSICLSVLSRPSQAKLTFFFVVGLAIPRITTPFRLEKGIILHWLWLLQFWCRIFGTIQGKNAANALCISEYFNEVVFQKFTLKTASDTKANAFAHRAVRFENSKRAYIQEKHLKRDVFLHLWSFYTL